MILIVWITKNNALGMGYAMDTSSIKKFQKKMAMRVCVCVCVCVA